MSVFKEVGVLRVVLTPEDHTCAAVIVAFNLVVMDTPAMVL